MIRISRSPAFLEIENARADKIIKDSMIERGYVFLKGWSSLSTRCLDFQGASPEAEMRDYQNGILADILSLRLPGILIEIRWA